ncbi:MAG: shikimate dehydrogenase [Candidatus Omnitrophota bacterium]|jgi:shikimate dehydrogenase
MTYGLIGYPVKHSLSPVMHNAAFRELGINASYRLFEIPPQDIPAFLNDPAYSFSDTSGNRQYKTADLSGFNVTIPHKIAVKEILEKKYPGQPAADNELYYVRVSGAINTVKNQGGIISYRNTDVLGFLYSLKEDVKFSPKGKNVMLIGCGGAGRAIIAGLTWEADRADRIYILENNPRSSENAQKQFLSYGIDKMLNSKNEEIITFITRQDLAAKLAECDLLVNASPMGMKEDDGSPVDREWLKKGLSVYDIVYNRPTRLLEYARSAGLSASGGLGMLLYQGAAAFEFWTGSKAPVEVMRKALKEAAGL